MTLAGFYEFRGIRDSKHAQTTWRQIASAYTAMQYDLGVLFPETSRQLQNTPLAKWPVVDAEPVLATRTVRSKTIGCMFLPIPAGEQARQALERDIRNQAAAIRPTVDLFIGISPWGKSREQAFLENNPGLFDLLLGSGSGGAVNHTYVGDNQTLWIRPYTKGKVVNTVFLPDWQNLDLQSGRLPRHRITIEAIALDERFQKDSDINAIFSQSP
ncbi:MAG: hypothetical protein K9J81_00650 [Desulfohalobiaceae bacterium]|nr:hypothetical protein [Desulfohalobiaceae bacterium]